MKKDSLLNDYFTVTVETNRDFKDVLDPKAFAILVDEIIAAIPSAKWVTKKVKADSAGE